jgi:hypothetical protein
MKTLKKNIVNKSNFNFLLHLFLFKDKTIWTSIQVEIKFWISLQLVMKFWKNYLKGFLNDEYSLLNGGCNLSKSSNEGFNAWSNMDPIVSKEDFWYN